MFSVTHYTTNGLRMQTEMHLMKYTINKKKHLQIRLQICVFGITLAVDKKCCLKSVHESSVVLCSEEQRAGMSSGSLRVGVRGSGAAVYGRLWCSWRALWVQLWYISGEKVMFAPFSFLWALILTWALLSQVSHDTLHRVKHWIHMKRMFSERLVCSWNSRDSWGSLQKENAVPAVKNSVCGLKGFHTFSAVSLALIGLQHSPLPADNLLE